MHSKRVTISPLIMAVVNEEKKINITATTFETLTSKPVGEIKKFRTHTRSSTLQARR